MKTSFKSLVLAQFAALFLLSLGAAVETAEARRRHGGATLSETGVGGSPPPSPKPIVRDHRDGYPQWAPRCRRGGCRRPLPPRT